MTDTHISRQPKGTTTGGQFAPSANPESTVDLVESTEPAGDLLVLGQPFARPRQPYERVHGAKYDSNLTTPDIAKRIRQDVKDAVSTGNLPSDADISVTSERFAGGSAINIRLSNWPGATVPQDDSKCTGTFDQGGIAYPSHCENGRHDWRCAAAAHPSEEAVRVQAALQSIHESYNFDASEMMTDYFSVNYYGQVKVDEYRPPIVAPGLAPLSKTGSLAELKRAITVGTVLEVTQHPTWPDIVGVRRPVSKVQSGGFSLRTVKSRDGGSTYEVDSSMDFGRASDVVFDRAKGEFSIGNIRYRIVTEEN